MMWSWMSLPWSRSRREVQVLRASKRMDLHGAGSWSFIILWNKRSAFLCSPQMGYEESRACHRSWLGVGEAEKTMLISSKVPQRPNRWIKWQARDGWEPWSKEEQCKNRPASMSFSLMQSLRRVKKESLTDGAELRKWKEGAIALSAIYEQFILLQVLHLSLSLCLCLWRPKHKKLCSLESFVFPKALFFWGESLNHWN